MIGSNASYLLYHTISAFLLIKSDTRHSMNTKDPICLHPPRWNPSLNYSFVCCHDDLTLNVQIQNVSVKLHMKRFDAKHPHTKCICEIAYETAWESFEGMGCGKWKLFKWMSCRARQYKLSSSVSISTSTTISLQLRTYHK